MRASTRFPMLRSGLADLWDIDDFFTGDVFRGQSTPAVNVTETDNSYELDFAVPGMKKEDFKVNIDNGVLSVSAESKSEKEDKTKNYTRREFRFSSFNRSFTLPENVNENEVDAKYSEGILHVTVAKKAPSKAVQKKDITVH